MYVYCPCDDDTGGMSVSDDVDAGRGGPELDEAGAAFRSGEVGNEKALSDANGEGVDTVAVWNGLATTD